MTEWFEEWFGEEYLRLYPHRNEADAERLVALIGRTIGGARPGRVLDIACGAGRHARAFEALGYSVIGLDLSRILLTRAREVSRAPLVQGDIRWLPFRPGSADLTVNLFTSFGYFEADHDHQRALDEMLATVRPGGWFVLDFLNATWVRRTLVPTDTLSLDGTSVAVERRLEEGDRFVVKTITVPGGRRFRERVRLYERAELVRMVESARGRVRAQFGTYDGEPPADDRPRVVLFAEVGR
jgi:SAM-dependent methyltransferase